MAYRIWLVFAQTATILLATFFVVSTLRPEWVSIQTEKPRVVELKQAPATPQGEARHSGSFREAVSRAQPAVVNIFTSKQVKAPRHPLMDDPLFRH